MKYIKNSFIKIFLLLIFFGFNTIILFRFPFYYNQYENNLTPSQTDYESLPIYWSKSYGGKEYDTADKILINESNIYIAGSTESYGVKSGAAYLLKLNYEGNIIWNNTWDTNYSDNIRDIALYSNNIYILGYSINSTSYENFSYILKYNLGGELEWDLIIDSDEIYLNSMIIDSSENIFMGGVNNTNGNSDILFLKLDKDGKMLWNNTWDGNESENLTEMAFDSQENIIITGSIADVSGADILVAKFDKSANIIWNVSWRLNGQEYANEIVLDSSDNIYITGWTDSISLGEWDTLLLKYNTSGNLLYSHISEINNHDNGNAIYLDSNLNIFLIGEIEISSGNHDLFLMKYNSEGEFQWIRTWGDNSQETGSDLCIDGYDNIFLIGDKPFQNGTDFDTDIFLLKTHENLLSENGNLAIFQWIPFIIIPLFIVVIFSILYLFRLKIPFMRKIMRYTPEKIQKIKKFVLNSSTKFKRMQLSEISEELEIKDKQIISETIKKMIQNDEIHADYYKKSESVVFDQELNIEEIDNLMDTYKEWEKKEFDKKG
ncbi:MAG: hypothetical protein EU549_02610 [Promethearchaeota archaeon]|nr:MAG: hypothetical protein EU549_02610 [Candidatus Lokiarchaeota archaeon]